MDVTLGDLAARWVDRHLDVELMPWQREYLRSFYEVTSQLEG